MIRLQIQFDVADGDRDEFERMYRATYLPALRRQEGFQGSSLLSRYPVEVLDEIGAAQLPFTYQLELDFDTEYDRKRWAESQDHEQAWAEAVALARSVQACGYDVVASMIGE